MRIRREITRIKFDAALISSLVIIAGFPVPVYRGATDEYPMIRYGEVMCCGVICMVTNLILEVELWYWLKGVSNISGKSEML